MASVPQLAALALAVAGAASRPAASGPAERGATLEIANADRGTLVRVALAPGERFSVTSTHSIYGAPYTETFAVRRDGRLELREVSSPSAAVREYLALTAAGEVQPVRRVIPELVFRIAMGEPQRLRAGGAERSFLELGEHGDRVVVRAAPGGGGAGEPATRASR